MAITRDLIGDSNMKITVCTTATLRPEILKRTYDSFWDRMLRPGQLQFGLRFDLRINIDPVGHNIEYCKVLDVANQYPWATIKHRSPANPSFPRAFIWTMAGAETPLIINLEEDWQLLQPVDWRVILDSFDEDPTLAVLRLPMFHSGPTSMKTWGHFIPWNGMFYQCPDEMRIEIGFCGHPSIIRSDFIHKTLPHLDARQNPEKQYHYVPAIMRETLNWKFGIYGIPNAMPFIKDIGREWMQRNGWVKEGPKAVFTNWKKEESNVI